MEILLVDDHRSVVEGTKMLIESEPDMKVAIETDVYYVPDVVRLKKFDVMLFDLYMPNTNGADLTRKVLEYVPDAVILIYSGFDIAPHFNLLMESGVSGFIAKTSTREQLIQAIRCAARKEAIVPMQLLKQLRRQEIVVAGDTENEKTTITPEEEKLLRELAKGKSNKDISKTLMISQRSLEYSLTELFQKLHVSSRVEVIKKAKSLGILPTEDLF
ncbi:response regulator transcription factor [Paenibacillus alginolyticus]|uniref:Response regulator transcription factor n=1 Tax=Paenibacillus alginolyticus TaxID=59839 RepID=A0ABT4GP66_9BACL|nr:response regulator transcription factor [Paenibacillus alginolyticus]MCY9698006.1 response regulator transcription factor [Paenibacillus alginolyticus]MEC0148455.1 response regulator transcription factor [Paenibacillus alginolyticus]